MHPSWKLEVSQFMDDVRRGDSSPWEEPGFACSDERLRALVACAADAVFEPSKIIRETARVIAAERSLPPDWLNDAAKGFFATPPPQKTFREWTNLRAWAPIPEYMLAMKCVSARYDTSDADDVRFQVDVPKLSSPEQVLSVVAAFYPYERIPAKNRFLSRNCFKKGLINERFIG